MKLSRSDWLTGGAGLFTGGPIGAILSPVVFRALKAKKRPVLYWALLGVVSGPWCWALVSVPFALVFPETPEQAAARKREENERAESERKLAAAREKSEKQRLIAEKHEEQRRALVEESRRFNEWAKSISPLIGCKTELKEQLRDPGSYEDDWAQPSPIIDSEKKVVSYVWSFRSKNGFGGYMSAAAACETTPDKDSSSSNWGGYGVPRVNVIQSP